MKILFADPDLFAHCYYPDLHWSAISAARSIRRPGNLINRLQLLTSPHVIKVDSHNHSTLRQNTLFDEFP